MEKTVKNCTPLEHLAELRAGASALGWGGGEANVLEYPDRPGWGQDAQSGHNPSH